MTIKQETTTRRTRRTLETLHRLLRHLQAGAADVSVTHHHPATQGGHSEMMNILNGLDVATLWFHSVVLLVPDISGLGMFSPMEVSWTLIVQCKG